MNIGWGIDVGVASLGFAVIELDASGQPKSLIDGVSIVYPAPTGAAERTRYKSMRTQNGRGARRMKTLRAELTRLFALDPEFDSVTAWPELLDGEKKDGTPRRNTSRVRLRAHGLTQSLGLGDLARAILHIAKNRGQRLTRGLKDDAKADDKQQKIQAKDRQTMADTANNTKAALTALGMTGDAHPAQILMERAGDTGVTRLKKDRDDVPVFTRAMVKLELEALLNAQKEYHASLTDSVRKALPESVFKEEDQKPPIIGKCRYRVRDAGGEIESRLPRGSDLFQRKRIYEEVNNLRLISMRTAAESQLDKVQRDKLTTILLDGQNLTAVRLRKTLGLGAGGVADKSNLDIVNKGAGRKTSATLKGHPLAYAMAKAGTLEQWRQFNDTQREKIAILVRSEDDVDALKTDLASLGLSAAAIEALSDARLPATYSAAGATTTQRLLVQLEADVISNYDAEQRAGLDSLDSAPPRLDRLPYYGEVLRGSCIGGSDEPGDPAEQRFGRIPNSVVHVGLNQIRKAANAYLDLYGKPVRICVELARDLNKSAEDRE